MPKNTFLIKDILNSDTEQQQCVTTPTSVKRLFSPISLTSSPVKRFKSQPQLQQQQQKQQQVDDILKESMSQFENIFMMNGNFNCGSVGSNSSSCSSSIVDSNESTSLMNQQATTSVTNSNSTSTSSSPSSSSSIYQPQQLSQQSQQPENFFNQFYSRILYYNYQRLCQEAANIAATPIQNTIPSPITIAEQQHTDRKSFRKYDKNNNNLVNETVEQSKQLKIEPKQADGVSPLDALLNLANTTFTTTTTNTAHTNNSLLSSSKQFSLSEKCDKLPNSLLDIVGTPGTSSLLDVTKTSSVSSSLKRRRKNRTAFTAHQIYELEKRFALQRYLSPTDRDRISQELCLSTAQVITWFQNRRAKQKRDLEELKNDVIATKTFCGSVTGLPGDEYDVDEDVDADDCCDSNSNLSYESNTNIHSSHSDLSLASHHNMSV